MYESWNNVKETTIKNCFNKCKYIDDDSIDVYDGSTIIGEHSIEPLFERLAEFEGETVGTFQDFVNIGEYLLISSLSCDVTSDINEYEQKEEEEEEEEEEDEEDEEEDDEEEASDKVNDKMKSIQVNLIFL